MIKINIDNIFYRKHYKEFKKELVKEINYNYKNKVIFKLDIENFYDNISVFKFLKLLESNIKSSKKEELNFNYETQKIITNFYKFYTNNKGIPQGDNDIISAYISNLFLTFLDLDIDDILKNTYGIVNYKIIRYIDDMYIVLDLEEGSINNLNITIIKNKIIDLIYGKYSLPLNNKCDIYYLNINGQRESIRKAIKTISLSYADIEDEDPNQVIEDIFRTLREIKTQKSINVKEPEWEDTLKKVYDNSINNLLHKQENIRELESIFENFDYSLITTTISEIASLMSLSDKVKRNFIDYAKKNPIDTRMISFILEFLCKTGMDMKSEFMELNPLLDKLLEFKDIDISNTGYYELDNIKYANLMKSVDIVNQISNRRICEINERWTEALNYLSNEFKTICYKCYCKVNKSANIKEDKFSAILAESFLYAQNIPNNLIIQIINMFDRRNNNGISHTIGKEVSKDEYIKYKQNVSLCVSKLSGLF